MNISDSVLLSTSISISTFFLGFIIKERISIYSKNKNIKDSDGYIKWCIKNTIDSLPKQTEGFQSLRSSIKNEEYRNWFINPELNPQRIIDKQELLHKVIFERKQGKYNKKNNIYNGLIANHFLLTSIIEESNLMFHRLNNEILNYESLLDDTGVKFYQKIMQIHTNINPDDIEKEILLIYNNFGERKTQKRSEIYVDLIQKIESFLIDQKYGKTQEYLEITSIYSKNYMYYITTLEKFYYKIEEYQQNLESLYCDLKGYYENYINLQYKWNIKN